MNDSYVEVLKYKSPGIALLIPEDEYLVGVSSVPEISVPQYATGS